MGRNCNVVGIYARRSTLLGQKLSQSQEKVEDQEYFLRPYILQYYPQ